MVHFTCHHCQQHLRAPDYKRSRISHCPACGQLICVPPLPPYPEEIPEEPSQGRAVAVLVFLLLFSSGILFWLVYLNVTGNLK